MERLKSSWILVLALLLGAHLHHLPRVQGLGVDEETTVCDLEDIDIHQVHRVTQGAYIVTITNKCFEHKAAECEARNLRIACPGFNPSNEVDRAVIYKKRGTNICVVNNKLPLTDQVVFAYFQTDQVAFTPLSVDFPGRCKRIYS